MKAKLAIWIPGGIGNGDFSQGYPMLEKLVNRLADDFQVFVYSQVPPNIGFAPKKFNLTYPPRSIKSGKLRWMVLLYFFFRENRKHHFDLIHAFWGYPAGFIVVILGKFLRIPNVINVMGADASGIASIDYGIFHRGLRRTIAQWAYSKATALVCLSEFQKKTLEGYGIHREMQVIPWGVEESAYQFSFRTPQAVLRLIHVGHINPVKDQVTMLKAFAIIRKSLPVKMKWFGLDCMQGEMKRYAQKLGIAEDIEFMNVVPYSDMPYHYGQADVMLHTSLTEGQCMALTEAAASGVLLAGTRVGLLWDMGEDAALIIESGDFESLANKVLDTVSKPEQWRSKVNHAHQWSVDHPFDWTITKYIDLLRAL